ncbi:MAG TPA: histidine kinase [Candidatus Limnocylindrales bacterium]|nr:histidine kinase [Candidatus Limnocylindrales bacterium]
MQRGIVPDIDRNISRCRLILSAVALLALFIDPTQPTVFREPREPQWFSIDPYTLTVFAVHLFYGSLVHLSLVRRLVSPDRLATVTTWMDVVFGATIAFFTEGASSPFYAFFIFAVVQVGFRGGFRLALTVTLVSMILYAAMIALSAPGQMNTYLMRPVYLAIIGYLVAYLGQQRLNLEGEIRRLAAAEQRNRIARDLHDGWAQALAGINLRIEAARELLRRGEHEAAQQELAELREGVNREYDDLRTFMRSLAGVASPATTARAPKTDVAVTVGAQFEGSAQLVGQVLQILREATSNVMCHSSACSANLHVQRTEEGLTISIDDDGVGFDHAEQQPWSIASRVRELGGQLHIVPRVGRGAHLSIILPVT